MVVSGPSGVGKGAIVARVRALVPDLRVSVSATTRPPRPGEVHGRHYWFVDPAEFQAMIESGGFLEWADVFGRRYGTPRAGRAWLDAGKHVVLGQPGRARQVRAASTAAYLIFIKPPSMAELERRLRTRATERGTDPPPARHGHRGDGRRTRIRRDRPQRRAGDGGQGGRLRHRPAARRRPESATVGRTLGREGAHRPHDRAEDRLLEHVDLKYTLVILAARRARQINGYAQLGEGIGEYVPPMVDAGPNRKPSRSPSRRSSRTSWWERPAQVAESIK